MNEQFDRVAMHAVRRRLLEAQADAAGMPLRTVPLPWPCTQRAVRSAHARGCRAGGRRRLHARGVRRPVSRGRAPVSGREAGRHRADADLPALGHPDGPSSRRRWSTSGLRAILTCVNPKHLDRSFAGRQFDRALLAIFRPASTRAASAANFIRSPGMGRCSAHPSRSPRAKSSTAMGSSLPMYPDSGSWPSIFCFAWRPNSKARSCASGSTDASRRLRSFARASEPSTPRTPSRSFSRRRGEGHRGLRRRRRISIVRPGRRRCRVRRDRVLRRPWRDEPVGVSRHEGAGVPCRGAPTPLFNDLPMQVFPVERRVPFVTVSSCTGTERRRAAIETRTGGAVESMEGRRRRARGAPARRSGRRSARHQQPRHRSRHEAWRLNEAAAAAQEAVLSWIARR